VWIIYTTNIDGSLKTENTTMGGWTLLSQTELQRFSIKLGLLKIQKHSKYYELKRSDVLKIKTFISVK